MALSAGTATAPLWINVLDAASEWGKAPWEIIHKPGPLVWWLRYCAYRQARIEAEKAAIEKIEKRGRRA